jgi:hypothetical protein
MQLNLILCLTTFAASLALAAECGFLTILHPNGERALWDLRQEMCSNAAGCEYQEACTRTTDELRLKRFNYGGKKGFPDCWVCIFYP